MVGRDIDRHMVDCHMIDHLPSAMGNKLDMAYGRSIYHKSGLCSIYWHIVDDLLTVIPRLEKTDCTMWET